MSVIKAVIINGKKIPVPIPLLSMAETVSWVQESLLQKEDTITRIIMNGVEIETDLVVGMTHPLAAETVIELQVDTPLDLTIQSIETIRNLSSVIMRCLKKLAVDLWQIEDAAKSQPTIKTLENLQSDLQLVIELIENARFIDERFESHLSRLAQYEPTLSKISLLLESAVSRSDWKGCAKLLLNNLEPTVNKIIDDSTIVESDIFLVSSKQGMNLSRF